MGGALPFPIRRTGVTALVLWLVLVWSACAEELPQWQSTRVNDFAGMLTPEDADRLEGLLRYLRDDTGVQGTVVTLTDRARYDGADGLEPFATRLFNHWGIGAAQTNDGFMLLVLRDDHEARIELGGGYPADADIAAQEIMRGVILPAMRDGRPSAAITEGTRAIISSLVLPYAVSGTAERAKIAANARLAEGATARDQRRGWTRFLIAASLILGGGAVVFRGIRRKRRCPDCGRWDLQKISRPLREATPDGGYSLSRTEIARHCPACGWRDVRQFPAKFITLYDREGHRVSRRPNPDAPRSGRGGDGFGSGSSRGGGASGRW